MNPEQTAPRSTAGAIMELAALLGRGRPTHLRNPPTPPLQQLNSHRQAFISSDKRQRKQRRAFYSQVRAAVPGICHVLTARVIEFIMRALEKLKADYGQPSPC